MNEYDRWCADDDDDELVHTFPTEADAITAPLLELSSDAHMAHGLYPLIARELAGKELSPVGALTAVTMAAKEYASTQAPVVSLLSTRLIRPIFRKLLPEGQFLDEVLLAAEVLGY